MPPTTTTSAPTLPSPSPSPLPLRRIEAIRRVPFPPPSPHPPLGAPALTARYHDTRRRRPDNTAHLERRPDHRIREQTNRVTANRAISRAAQTTRSREEARDASGAMAARGGRMRSPPTATSARPARPKRAFARRDGVPRAAAAAAPSCEDRPAEEEAACRSGESTHPDDRAPSRPTTTRRQHAGAGHAGHVRPPASA
ncbi:hypothetical protein RJ55_02907 [Drechmeria coniospora]|nr:hypothetical protein RJ55_02907 [Drechmeria coniospora]